MSHATGYTRHAVNGVPRPTRSQLRARRVWLRRDEQVAVEWRQVQRARNEAPSVVVVLPTTTTTTSDAALLHSHPPHCRSYVILLR